MKIVTRQQMNEIDTLSTSEYAIPSLLLMEHAAHEIFLAMLHEVHQQDRICIVCGHGNNGGDGFALARFFHMNQYQVSICFVGKTNKLTPDALMNKEICHKLKIPYVADFDGATILVDALFGTGLTRTIDEEYQAIIVAMNASTLPIYSIDIPSGIDCDNGKVLGCAIQATKTYTLQCGKMGLYLQPGRSYAGKVEVLPIYIPTPLVDRCESETYLIEKEMMIASLPKRTMNSHKGTYGKVLCIGGSSSMSGAICLAAKSALASGCGTITCAIPEEIQPIIQTTLLESMSIALPSRQGFLTRDSATILSSHIHQYTTILFGCGLGRSESMQEIGALLWESNIPLIIDADGLYAIKPLLKDRQQTIITPHIKEFAYLMDTTTQAILENEVSYIDQFTKQYPTITLVLKSDTTIIAKGEQRYVNTYGNSGLSVGGSGDVLAGIISGIYAQNKDALLAAIVGVFLHAYSADCLLLEKSEYSMIPSDLIKQVEKVLAQSMKGEQ